MLRPHSSSPSDLRAASARTSARSTFTFMPRSPHHSAAKRSSRSASSPRSIWFTCAAVSEMPCSREYLQRKCVSVTESAPPEKPATTEQPSGSMSHFFIEDIILSSIIVILSLTAHYLLRGKTHELALPVQRYGFCFAVAVFRHYAFAAVFVGVLVGFGRILVIIVAVKE